MFSSSSLYTQRYTLIYLARKKFKEGCRTRYFLVASKHKCKEDMKSLTLQTNKLSSLVGWWWVASGGETKNHMTLMTTWTTTIEKVMASWDLGEMQLGLLALRFEALKIREILLVLVNSAPYTMEKQRPMPNSWTAQTPVVGRTCKLDTENLRIIFYHLSVLPENGVS